MMTVANIRSQDIRITKDSIVYYWWFKTACFEQLLNLLNHEIEFDRILVKEIDGELLVIDNIYFTTTVRITAENFRAHCEEI